MTIQASGRLGFTEDTAKFLRISERKGVVFAKDDEMDRLYLVMIDVDNEDAFPIRESSGYYYVNARGMFDLLGMDYHNQNIMFDLVRQTALDESLGGEAYYMKPRINKRKEKKNDNMNA